MSYDRECEYCGAENAANRDSCWKCSASFTAPGEFIGAVAAARAPTTDRSSKLRARYRDGFRAAALIEGFGGAVKIVGFVFAALCLLGGMAVGRLGLILGVVAGAVLGALFFILGVFISSQGQLLKATLDSAVHTSPFLDDEGKAAAMGL
jgi:hypothetical protein